MASAFDYTIQMTPTPFVLVTDFDRLGLDIRSFREPLKRSVQKVFAPSIQKNFDAGGRPEEWAPLSDDTIRQKSAKGSSNPSQPLVDAGKLQRVAGQLNVWQITSDFAQVTDLPGAQYGGVHQFGFEPNIPQRPFLVLQEDDEDKMTEIFEDWLLERFVAVGNFI